MSTVHAVFTTFFISMVPVLELRGAIPVGVAGGLSPLFAMILAVIGNMVPVPFVILFIRRIFSWLKRWPKLCPVIEKLEQRGSAKSLTVRKYERLGLFILVAIPLPGTGAWTGALVAALMNMRLKSALPSIFLGVLTAGFLVTCLSYGVLHLLG